MRWEAGRQGVVDRLMTTCRLSLAIFIKDDIRCSQPQLVCLSHPISPISHVIWTWLPFHTCHDLSQIMLLCAPLQYSYHDVAVSMKFVMKIWFARCEQWGCSDTSCVQLAVCAGLPYTGPFALQITLGRMAVIKQLWCCGVRSWCGCRQCSERFGLPVQSALP